MKNILFSIVVISSLAIFKTNAGPVSEECPYSSDDLYYKRIIQWLKKENERLKEENERLKSNNFRCGPKKALNLRYNK